MSCKNRIGLHVRLDSNLASLTDTAQNYDTQIFQFFLVQPKNDKYIKITPEELENFLKIKKEHDFDFYIHSSYWINLCTGKPSGAKASQEITKKELDIAKKLNIKYLVLHPGSATGHRRTNADPLSKKAGLKALARRLNRILKEETEVEILLENTAHGNRTIGSNIEDFAILQKMFEFPEKINYCLDLGHAFAYGYDLEKTDAFINLIDKNMEIDKIKLIHIHDSAEKQGSKLDKHEVPGKGFIPEKHLIDIINHPKLKDIPVIIEAPPLSLEENKEVLDKVKGWL